MKMTFYLSHTNSVLDIRPCWLALFTPGKYCWHGTVLQTSVMPFRSRPGHILLLEVPTTHHCFFIHLRVKQFFAAQLYLRKNIHILLTKIESTGNRSMYYMQMLQLSLTSNFEPGSRRILAIHSLLNCLFFGK